RPFIGRAFAEADAQERGFADAVAANDAGGLRRFERKSQPAKEPALAVAFADLRPSVGQLDGVVSQFRRRRNEQIHFPFLGRRFEALDLVKRFEAMPRFGSLRADPRADPIQFLAQKSLPPPLGLFGDLLPDGLGFQVGGVISRMRKTSSISQLDDPRRND